MTRHKHYDVIIAYAEGREVQRKNCYGNWIPCPYPTFKPEEEYRIVPEVSFLYTRQCLYYFKSSNDVRVLLFQCNTLEELQKACDGFEQSDKDFLKWVSNIEKVEYVKPTSN